VLKIVSPGRDEDVPLMIVGKKRLQNRRVFGVVQDQQPVLVRSQPVLDGRSRLVQVLLVMGQRHLPGDIATAGL